jgi:hypothetical protein
MGRRATPADGASAAVEELKLHIVLRTDRQ